MSLISYSQFQEQFRVKRELGRGNCASVFKIQSSNLDWPLALKVCRSSNFTNYGQITSEIEIITKLNDEAIPNIYHYYYRDEYNSKGGRLIEVGIIMELCDRTLQEEISLIHKNKTKAYNQKRLWEFMREMVRFFAKMQRLGYNHRDIKPGNIMIKDQDNIRKYKVIDFGYSLKDTRFASQSITGTAEYASPKIKRKFENPSIHIPGGLNVKDDVYSLGKTILELLTGEKIPNQKLKPQFFKGQLRKFDPNIALLLQKMLEYQEKERWDFVQVEEVMIKIEFSQSHDLPSQKFPISREKIKDLRTIETQTESVQIQSTSIEELKYHNSHINSEQTRYFENKSITSEIFLSRCSFEAEVYSIKAFDDFVLLGMKNHIGVISLRHKNNAIYMLRPKWFDGRTRLADFHKIMLVGTKIVFIGFFQHFFFCELNDLYKQLNSLFDNHQQMKKKRVIRQCLRKSFKKTDYREPYLFEGKLKCLENAKSYAKISCIHFTTKPFLGFPNTLILGHKDGTISIFDEKSPIYKDDNEIIEIVTYDDNKLLFSTAEGWMKLVVYPQQKGEDTVEPKVYKFNAGSQIIRFRLLNPVKTKPNFSKTYQDEPLAEVYTKNGEKSYLDHSLLRLKMETLKRDVIFSKVLQSPWKWSLITPVDNLTEKIQAQRKISQTQPNTQKMETYLVSDEGKVFEEKDLSVVIDFKMPKSIVFEVSGNLLAIADQHGNVKLLYPERIFDNMLRPKVPVENKELSKRLQKMCDYFQIAEHNSSEESSSTNIIAKDIWGIPQITRTFTQLHILERRKNQILSDVSIDDKVSIADF